MLALDSNNTQTFTFPEFACSLIYFLCSDIVSKIIKGLLYSWLTTMHVFKSSVGMPSILLSLSHVKFLIPLSPPLKAQLFFFAMLIASVTVAPLVIVYLNLL